MNDPLASITTPLSDTERDPHDLNASLKTDFSDVFGEPPELESPEFCWNFSKAVYTYTNYFLYIILVVLLSPIIAFLAGIFLGFFAFLQIWLIGPILRLWKISFDVIRNFSRAAIYAIIGPLMETFAVYLSKIKIRYQKIPESEYNKPTEDDRFFQV